MSAKAHFCIGGPLDGEHAASEDFHGYRQRDDKGKVIPYHRTGYVRPEPGMYEHLSNEYVQFNTANHGAARSDVVWIHRSRLPGSIPMSRR